MQMGLSEDKLYVRAVDVDTIIIKARQEAIDYHQDRWTQEELADTEMYERSVSYTTRYNKLNKFSRFVYDHYDDEEPVLYVYGSFHYGEVEPHWYEIYGVDTDVDGLLLKPFHYESNRRNLAIGADWSEDDEAMKWSPNVSSMYIAMEVDDELYLASGADFDALDIAMKITDTTTNKEKKILLDRGED